MLERAGRDCPIVHLYFAMPAQYSGQHDCPCGPLPSPNKTAEHALVMIDVDVLKSKMLGSPEGAREFAAFLRANYPDWAP